MEDPTTEAAQCLAALSTLRQRFEIGAHSLPADLAVLGLLDDLLDSASVAIALTKEARRAAYPLVRTAFEAAQRIVALATDDDYLRTGARAWVYYQRKDASVLRKTKPDSADRWFETVMSQMRSVWAPHNRDAEALLREENTRLEENEKKHRTDNFMGTDLAPVVQARYDRVFKGSTLQADLQQVNRGIYAALSRDSHARLRIEPSGLKISANGIVEIVARAADDAGKRRTLLGCLETALIEATGALVFRLAARDRADAERLREGALAGATAQIPAGFTRDLGLHLTKDGGGKTTFHFLHVPVRTLGILPHGVVSWSSNIDLGDAEFMATFDVPRSLFGDLASALHVSPTLLRPSRNIVKHKFDVPPTVAVECTLGELQRNAEETFVPLIVTRVVSTDSRSANTALQPTSRARKPPVKSKKRVRAARG